MTFGRPLSLVARRQAQRRALLAALVLPLLACGRKPPRAQAVPRGATVLALGDSLTFGTGAAPGQGYPEVLAPLSGWQVVNAGVPGDTSAQALERLPGLLQAHAPKLVIASVGGNDLLRGQNVEALRANIESMAKTVQATGAQWLLVAVPKPSVAAAALGSLSDHPLYGELAEQHGWVLQRQGWAEVLSDDNLRSDRIHANAAGYAQFARSLVATARASGLLA